MNAPLDQKSRALALHRSGRLGEALSLYEACLKAAPQDPDVIGLMAIVFMQNGDSEKAREWLLSAVRLGAAKVDVAKAHLRNLNNLLVLLLEGGRGEDAKEAALEIPVRWPRGEVPEPSERGSIISLTKALLALGLHEKARDLWQDTANHLDGQDENVLEIGGRLELYFGSAETALPLLHAAAAADPSGFSKAAALAFAASQTGREAEAESAYTRLARIFPIYEPKARNAGVPSVLVLNSPPMDLDRPIFSPRPLHFKYNFPAQFADRYQNDYNYYSIFLETLEGMNYEKIPPSDIIINNMASPEAVSREVAGFATELVKKTGTPIINPPASVKSTTRYDIAMIANEVEGVKAPKTRFMHGTTADLAGMVDAIEAEFDYPAILRRPASHGTSDSLLAKSIGDVTAKLVRSRNEAMEFLRQAEWTRFYVIEFLDLQKPGGVYRKIRAVVIGDELIVNSAAFWDEWMVGGWRTSEAALDFYRTHPHCLAESREIVGDPVKFLGVEVMEALRNFRNRIPLDFFGIDFDVDTDGTAIIFEASAAMIFLPVGDPPEEVALPTEPFERIVHSFKEMIDRKIGIPRAKA